MKTKKSFIIIVLAIVIIATNATYLLLHNHQEINIVDVMVFAYDKGIEDGYELGIQNHGFTTTMDEYKILEMRLDSLYPILINKDSIVNVLKY